MNGFFVTGTDTGVGKTALSALLLAEFRRRGINAAPMKAVQTGCGGVGVRLEALGVGCTEKQPQSLLPNAQRLLSVPDLDYSLSMAGMTVSEEDYQTMAPYRFKPACSPHLAAELAGTEIEISRIVCAAQVLSAKYDTLIVEGAGGVLVPLNRRETMLDLMKALQLPVLLAARPGLGTVNHTLLSIRALREAELRIAGIVLIYSTDQQPGFIENDNLATIEQFSEIPILGTISFCPQLNSLSPVFSALPPPLLTELKTICGQKIPVSPASPGRD